MKESDIKGLVELKREYEARLNKIPEYEKLATEFQDKALDMVMKAVAGSGLQAAKAGGATNMLPARCGFCTRCITDCVSCVAYA